MDPEVRTDLCAPDPARHEKIGNTVCSPVLSDWLWNRPSEIIPNNAMIEQVLAAQVFLFSCKADQPTSF